MAEQWRDRDVPVHNSNYQVSDYGQVRNTHTGKILQPVRMKNGRLYVTLSTNGFQRKCTVHSLVARAFLGGCPPEHETTHKNGDYHRQKWSPLKCLDCTPEPLSAESLRRLSFLFTALFTASTVGGNPAL
jgi:NUMOD4 motif-containing protein